jgi:hypothetical protein
MTCHVCGFEVDNVGKCGCGQGAPPPATTPTRPRCVHGYEPGECDTNTCPNWNWRARSDHAFDAEGRALKRRYAEQRGRINTKGTPR